MRWPKKWKQKRWRYRDWLQGPWWLMWFVPCNWISHHFFHFHSGNWSPKPVEDGGEATGGTTAATSDSYCWKKDATWAVNSVQTQAQMSLLNYTCPTYVSYRRVLRLFQILHRVWSSAQSGVGAERVYQPVCSTEVKDVSTSLPPRLPSASVQLPSRNSSNAVFPESNCRTLTSMQKSHWWASVCVWWSFRTKDLNIVNNLDPRWNYFIKKNIIYNNYLYRSTL